MTSLGIWERIPRKRQLNWKENCYHSFWSHTFDHLDGRLGPKCHTLMWRAAGDKREAGKQQHLEKKAPTVAALKMTWLIVSVTKEPLSPKFFCTARHDIARAWRGRHSQAISHVYGHDYHQLYFVQFVNHSYNYILCLSSLYAGIILFGKFRCILCTVPYHCLQWSCQEVHHMHTKIIKNPQMAIWYT